MSTSEAVETSGTKLPIVPTKVLLMNPELTNEISGMKKLMK